MDVAPLLTDFKEHARVDGDDDNQTMLLMLVTAAQDVAHAAGYTLPDTTAALPDDLLFAIVDQATMLYDARGGDVERPHGLSLAASRIVARYRGVSFGLADVV